MDFMIVVDLGCGCMQAGLFKGLSRGMLAFFFMEARALPTHIIKKEADEK